MSTEEAKDYSQENWHKVKGKFPEVWGRLTDDDLEKIQGKLEQLYGVLQEKYGYTRAEAERAYKEVRHRFKD
ncbi:MAG: CsbD family protein [Alphaproteobacteria bacterium]